LNSDLTRESLLEVFIYESQKLLGELEQAILESEKTKSIDDAAINKIFRAMHTIKGSSSMMCFNNIASLTHSVEDLFYFLREEKPAKVDSGVITDVVLECADFIKVEMQKLENGSEPNGNEKFLAEKVKELLLFIKQDNGATAQKDVKSQSKAGSAVLETKAEKKAQDASFFGLRADEKCYRVTIYFQEDCGMENIRAYNAVHTLIECSRIFRFIPEDILENNETVQTIKNEGFKLYFCSDMKLEELENLISQILYISRLELDEVSLQEASGEILNQPKETVEQLATTSVQEAVQPKGEVETKPVETLSSEVKQVEAKKPEEHAASTQKFISVNVAKLDKLMDLMGELVISEAMVTQHPELAGIKLKNYYKASRQLKKITSEMQDTVMEIRMVPLSSTFQKINRLARDMGRKLEKEIDLEIIGEETEVDKNIIENISDPLMHIIRNSMDHGIETQEERLNKGKPSKGRIILEAKNTGGEVWIIVKDDGKGLDRQRILEKAKKAKLLHKPESEVSDREIYSMIFLPGFSTKENVTEFSGRGVGMDVVKKNIEKLGGVVLIDSKPGEGTTISIRIPLTLAIIDGMIISVGKWRYIVPTISIKESFRLKQKELIIDPEGNEMLMVRGECYPVIRMEKLFCVEDGKKKMEEGIFLMVEDDEDAACLFVDKLIGKQQVVVKAIPKFIKRVRGISGCTLLGDGEVSLIMDVAALVRE